MGAVAAVAASGRKGPEVQISVADKGIGIASADLPHIFEPFYRGADAQARQIHGNGLGLSIVKGIVEAHGGSVTVRAPTARAARSSCTCRPTAASRRRTRAGTRSRPLVGIQRAALERIHGLACAQSARALHFAFRT